MFGGVTFNFVFIAFPWNQINKFPNATKPVPYQDDLEEVRNENYLIT